MPIRLGYRAFLEIKNVTVLFKLYSKITAVTPNLAREHIWFGPPEREPLPHPLLTNERTKTYFHNV